MSEQVFKYWLGMDARDSESREPFARV